MVIGDKIWIHYAGRTFTAPLTKERASKGRSGSSGQSDRIKSPMPGKVTRLQKSVGERVEIGETVLIMEAMKMEYSLKAEVNGEVAEVSCRVGDQVALGQTLVKFKVKAKE